MNSDGVHFNLSEFPTNKRLEVWAEYVRLSQYKAPVDLTGVWNNGHLYIHQSKTNPNQFILKAQSLLFDGQYRQLNLSEIFQITLDLMSESNNKTSARLVIESLSGKIKTSNPEQDAKKLSEIFKKCLEEDVQENAQRSELRNKIQALRKYLASKNICGAYSHDLEQQYKELVILLQAYWKPFHLNGVYTPLIVNGAYHPQETPTLVSSSHSFLAEFQDVPPELRGLYEETLKGKFGIPNFMCYFVIQRNRLQPELLAILERSFKDVVMQHLKDSKQIIFNVLGQENLQPDPVFVKTFIDYIKDHSKSVPRIKQKTIQFCRYHEALLEILPYSRALIINSITSCEAETFAKKIRELHQQKIPGFTFSQVYKKDSEPEGLEFLRELAKTPEGVEEGPFLIEEDAEKLIIISRQQHKKGILEFLESTPAIAWPEDMNKLDSIFVQTFIEHVKDVFMQHQLKNPGSLLKLKHVEFPCFHEVLLEILPYCADIRIKLIAGKEVEALAKRIKELHAQRVKWLPTIFIFGKGSLDDRSMKSLKDLETMQGPFEEGPYVIVDATNNPEALVMRPKKFVNELEELCKAVAKAAARMEEQEDSSFLVPLPNRSSEVARQKKKTLTVAEEEEQKRVREELRRRNETFLNRLQPTDKPK